MTSSQSLKLYHLTLRYFRNENDAKSFVTEIEAVIENNFEMKSTGLAEKKDFYLLKEDIHKLEKDIHKLDKNIADTKAELTKSIYTVGLVQFLAIVASVVGVLAVMLKK